MKRPSWLYSFFLLSSLSLQLMASAIPMLNGRYNGGPVTVLTLTDKQRSALEQGYEIDLTWKQSNILKKQSKVRVYKLTVYDSRKGKTNDEELIYNIALRFSDTEIEVPHKYLIRPEKAKWLEEQLNGL